jgi:hypothetical protein
VTPEQLFANDGRALQIVIEAGFRKAALEAIQWRCDYPRKFIADELEEKK